MYSYADLYHEYEYNIKINDKILVDDLYLKLNRVESIVKLNNILDNLNQVNVIESSIWEFTLLTAFNNNYDVDISCDLYTNKLINILDYLNHFKDNIKNIH